MKKETQKATHTQGAMKILDNKGIYTIVNEEGENFCYRVNATTMDRRKNKSNARLISAAPDMLAVLHEIKEAVMKGKKVNGTFVFTIQLLNAIFEQSEKVIAKAEGK